jgi:polysaccharide export outer membrane protein
VKTESSRALLLALAATLALSTACRHAGDYVWVHDLPDSAGSDPEYQIAPGDVLAVRVWNEETMSGRARVRSDGKISLPFVNDVAAAGMSPNALARDLELRLNPVVNRPHVTVALDEERLLPVSVVGEVAKPGVYELLSGSGVLQAVASAGGTTQWASKDRIFVLRRAADRGDRPLRIRFSYEALSRAEKLAAGFRLRRGDVVVVE